MSLPNTQKIKIDKSLAVKPDWYQAILIGHVEKDSQNVISSHLEFMLVGEEKHIWSVMAHEESSLYLIKRLKQALGMADDETDLTPYHSQHLQLYVDNVFKDGKVINEIKDFDKYVKPPKEPVKPAPEEPSSTAYIDISGKKVPRLILIVDDQPEVAKLIGNYIEQIGFIPDIVANVDEAIKKFDPEKYLMVVSDVIMPGKNGFDLVRALHNKYRNVPVALISGYFDKEMENLQKLFGIEKIYKKPVFFKSVKAMVAAAIQKIPSK